MTSTKHSTPDTETAASRRNTPGEGYVLGLSGGSASGKSTLAAELAKREWLVNPDLSACS